MVALEGIGKLRDLVLTTVCVCANGHTHTCKRGNTWRGPPLRVHYSLVFVVSVVCTTARMCSVCHALLVPTSVSL